MYSAFKLRSWFWSARHRQGWGTQPTCLQNTFAGPGTWGPICCFSRVWTCNLRLMKPTLCHWAIKQLVARAGFEPTASDLRQMFGEHLSGLLCWCCSTIELPDNWVPGWNWTNLRGFADHDLSLSVTGTSAEYQDRTASPVWKTGALPLSYIPPVFFTFKESQPKPLPQGKLRFIYCSAINQPASRLAYSVRESNPYFCSESAVSWPFRRTEPV